jgi:hypothetical protein
MVELTYSELKKALICCTVYRTCDGCPLYRGGDLGPVSAGDLTCTGMLMSAAMNCINVMEKDLADMTKKADNWEDQCTMREKELFELRESLDRKDYKVATAKEFAGFVQEWMTYTFPCAEDCDHKVQQVLDIYLNYLKQPKQPTEVKF